MAWSLILWESCFPLLLVAPRPLAILFLLMGIAFHGGAALFMGLNTFFWTFVATYPAVIHCARARII